MICRVHSTVIGAVSGVLGSLLDGSGRCSQTNFSAFILIMRNAGQRRFYVTPDSLGPKRTRVSVIVSRPIRLREGAVPIRRILIFDDHPATIRLLEDVEVALKRKNKLALVGCSALIVLLMLAMFWPLL